VVLEWHQPIDRKGEIKFTLKEAEQVRLFSEDLAAYSKEDLQLQFGDLVDKPENK
jgi:hypothetical protein